jgi:hypothetical protein
VGGSMLRFQWPVLSHLATDSSLARLVGWFLQHQGSAAHGQSSCGDPASPCWDGDLMYRRQIGTKNVLLCMTNSINCIPTI